MPATSKGWVWKVEFGVLSDGTTAVDATTGLLLGTRLLAEERTKPRRAP